MPVFLLIRHGENEYVKTGKLAGRLPEVHLNERGREQAAALAESLSGAPITAIYSSPLERAMETAQPIAATRGMEINIRQGLLETDLGEWQGQELKKLAKLPEWKIVQQAPSRFHFPGGESFLGMQARLVAEFEHMAQSHKPEDVVAVVFHADPIKLLIAYYLGMPLDNFQRIHVDTASLSILALYGAGATLVKQNLRAPFALHFPEPKKKRGKKE